MSSRKRTKKKDSFKDSCREKIVAKISERKQGMLKIKTGRENAK